MHETNQPYSVTEDEQNVRNLVNEVVSDLHLHIEDCSFDVNTCDDSFACLPVPMSKALSKAWKRLQGGIFISPLLYPMNRITMKYYTPFRHPCHQKLNCPCPTPELTLFKPPRHWTQAAMALERGVVVIWERLRYSLEVVKASQWNLWMATWRLSVSSGPLEKIW